ncbi:Glycosyltransferase, catalytic subunit of cellulose synthase and poly-beta-1,6-N-acetylglucosamine synthase [Mucilaginibacter gossypiicola]|uniref:Glycosyltransferase, catalytic subunit of cellulose synthase and poly-beta-1,6-N-acetylglucosamine synthase n=1 Tax=Mucilaginibacter gossypiicola TaxID=551995 RepID=A0A1H8ADY6_9SPHI|nr:glycosyltransferase [Mucilaginibacter gossypiicola]SEM68753.1 Glycosyltransferase, catalytic subunit of cellulose synthase and poly-beta-1,6-N-acetylglucosamine synthase [Mucilaginibacter gossypiicola]
MFFSIIIPLYNRPQEIKELLETLTLQTYRDFEVLVIEDGSVNDAEAIVNTFTDKLNLRYFKKQNEGQGFTRNFGFERAKGDYFVIFDSDCLIPPTYLEIVNNSLAANYLDAYGGPDGAHDSFTPTQKAISYSMTSPFTTGGIRGNKKGIGQFHPRSFNMGVSRQAWEKAGGFIITRLGEDIEYSIRIHSLGFKIGLIPDAIVYHKRRTNFYQFYKQLHFFGRARINISKFFPQELKLVHFFPAAFTLGVILTIILNLFGSSLALAGNFILLIFNLLIFFHAWWKNKSAKIAFLSIIAAFTQLIAYGLGFIQDFWKRKVLSRS